jgi:hypothetical protein
MLGDHLLQAITQARGFPQGEDVRLFCDPGWVERLGKASLQGLLRPQGTTEESEAGKQR